MQVGKQGFVGAHTATQVAAGLGGQPTPLSHATPWSVQGQPRGAHVPSTHAVRQGFEPSGQVSAHVAAGLSGQSSARVQLPPTAPTAC
jgi:hypothetical protein